MYFIVIFNWRIVWRIHTPKKNSEELREKFSNFELGVFFGVKIRQKHFFLTISKYQNFYGGYLLATEFPICIYVYG